MLPHAAPGAPISSCHHPSRWVQGQLGFEEVTKVHLPGRFTSPGLALGVLGRPCACAWLCSWKAAVVGSCQETLAVDGALQLLTKQKRGSTSHRPGRSQGGLNCSGKSEGSEGSRAGLARPAGSSWVCTGRREGCSSEGQQTRRGYLGDTTGGTGRTAEAGGEPAPCPRLSGAH